MKPKRNGRYFYMFFFYFFFLKNNVCIFITMSLKFVEDVNNNKSSLIQVMVSASHHLNWYWPRSMTHMCVTKSRCVQKTNHIVLVWLLSHGYLCYKICLVFIFVHYLHQSDIQIPPCEILTCRNQPSLNGKLVFPGKHYQHHGRLERVWVITCQSFDGCNRL